MAVVSPGRGIGGAAISKAPKPHTPRTPLKGLRKPDVFSVLFGLRSGGECPHSGPGVFGADAPRNFADSYTVPWETKRPYPAALSALDPETTNHSSALLDLETANHFSVILDLETANHYSVI